MEGDTELGLLVKNALDALELPVLDLQQWTPDKVLARFLPRRGQKPTPYSGHGGPM
jgi:predicted lipid carrier protein YhbT